MIKFTVGDLKDMHARLDTFTNFLRLADVADDDIFLSRLVSCELITNVIRHGGDEAAFTGVLTGDKIYITISADSLKNFDGEGNLPDVFAESGRGLYIVKSICGGGIERGDNGELQVYIKRH